MTDQVMDLNMDIFIGMIQRGMQMVEMEAPRDQEEARQVHQDLEMVRRCLEVLDQVLEASQEFIVEDNKVALEVAMEKDLEEARAMD